jgi:acyl-CoA synthetase (AMP-forming)/AMP-acid ligase II
VKAGHEITDEEITDFMNGKVASYKVVHDVVITDVIPKSASGKILRRLLRDQ